MATDIVAVKEQMSNLLIDCADILLENQIVEQTRDDREGGQLTTAGGFYCDGCEAVHSRSGDALFPLVYLYRVSGESRYAAAAEALLQFIEKTQEPDGAWRNEPQADWKGTTVFQLLSLCHAYEWLQRVGSKSDTEHMTSTVVLNKIEKMIVAAAEWVCQQFGAGGGTNVNYYITAALVLHLSGEITNNESYIKLAKRLMHWVIQTKISKDGWLYGEKTRKRPFSQMSSTVDIGYNLDMSIGAMAEYARRTGDEDVLQASLQALRTHLACMFPDGSIDNSFGSRNYKWTLYGSKTAHGSQMAFMLLADHDSTFVRAAQLNTAYLSKSKRESDRLFGYGPMHEQLFDKGCIHSVFNRADALAISLAYGSEECQLPANHKDMLLPSEQHFGIKMLQELGIWQLRSPYWMVSVNCSTVQNSPAGGSTGYVWHKQSGAVQACSMVEYCQYEEFNMPSPLPHMSLPVAPAVYVTGDDGVYSCLYEQQAAAYRDGDALVVKGKLKRLSDNVYYDCAASYEIRYWFEEEGEVLVKQYQIDLAFPANHIAVIEPVLITGKARTASEHEVEKGNRLNQMQTVIIPALNNRELEITAVSNSLRLALDSLEERAVSIFPSTITAPIKFESALPAAGSYKAEIRMKLRDIS